MPPIFNLGQTLRGKLGKYMITKEIQDGVWIAMNVASAPTVIKSVRGHFRVDNELRVLKDIGSRSPNIRQLVDVVECPGYPRAIVLQHLEDDLLHASKTKALSRKEIKYVSHRILKALEYLHKDGYVHTGRPLYATKHVRPDAQIRDLDVKPDNVLVNYGQGEMRFTDVQLADFGSCYHEDHKFAKEGAPIGAPIWRSPEALLQLPWCTATDIWSFGAVLIGLVYGGDTNLFRPKNSKFGDDDYELEILMQQFRFFGPFPAQYEEIADPDTVQVILYLMDKIPQKDLTSFSRISRKEVAAEENEFICGIMKLDPPDRPTAKALLRDEWFKVD